MNLLNLMQLKATKQCTYSRCKHEFPKGIITMSGRYDDKTLTWSPSGEYLFHYQDTHGFPHEMMIEELSKLVNKPMSEEDVATYNKLMLPVKESLA